MAPDLVRKEWHKGHQHAEDGSGARRTVHRLRQQRAQRPGGRRPGRLLQFARAEAGRTGHARDHLPRQPPGDLARPYLSQFILKDVPFGSLTISQHQQTVVAGQDYLTALEDWRNIQNGAAAGQDRFASQTLHPERT